MALKDEMHNQLAKINKTVANITSSQTARSTKDTQTQTNSTEAAAPGTQTQHETFADAVKYGSSTKKAHTTTTATTTTMNDSGKKHQGDNDKCNDRKEQDKKERHQKRHVDNDVKSFTKSSNTKHTRVAPKENTNAPKNTDTKQYDPDCPTVWSFNDSILKKIESKRLGNAYGFALKMKKTLTIAETRKEVLKDSDIPSPDVILLHVGINDLKHESAEKCSTEMIDLINITSKKFQNSKIVVSKVVPTGLPQLKAKSDLFNAYNVSEFIKNSRVTFITHENVKIDSQRLQADQIHLTERGTSVVAGNIGRFLHLVFWNKVESKYRRRRTQPHGQYYRRHWGYPLDNQMFTPWGYF